MRLQFSDRMIVLLGMVSALALTIAREADAVPTYPECANSPRRPPDGAATRGRVNLVRESGAGLDGCYRCGIAAADFDGDGRIDLVMAGAFDAAFSSDMSTYTFNNQVRLYRNVSCPGQRIRFQPVGPIEGVRGGGGAQVVTGDFDGDGRPDFAVQFRDGEPPESDTSGFLNRGSMRFDRVRLGAFDTNSTSLGMAAADFDRDGRDDLAFASDAYGAAPGLWYRYLPGERSWEAEQTNFSHRITYGGSLAAGDLDGDGYPDLVVGGNSDRPFGDYDCTSTVLYGEIHFNRGGRISPEGETLSRFALRVDRSDPPYCTGMDNAGIEIADVDGDGNQDIVIAGSAESFEGPPGRNGSHYDFVVLRNVDGSGRNFVTFENPGAPEPLGTTNGGSGNMDGDNIAAGDLNGDGISEVFIQGHHRDYSGDSTRYVFDSRFFLGVPGGSFEELDLGLPDVGEGGQVMADFNLDGKIDLVFAGATRPFHSNGSNPNDENDASTLLAAVYRNAGR